MSEQPVKSLGRWFDPSLRDKDQVAQLQREISSGVQATENTELPGKLKIWCLQFGLLLRVLWPLGLYKVPERLQVTRLQVTLMESQDVLVSRNVPAVAAGRKWRPARAIEEGVIADKNADTVGHVRHGRGGLGLTARCPAWSKASAAETRRVIVDEVKHGKEGARRAKVVSLGKQGQWTR